MLPLQPLSRANHEPRLRNRIHLSPIIGNTIHPDLDPNTGSSYRYDNAADVFLILKGLVVKLLC